MTSHAPEASRFTWVTIDPSGIMGHSRPKDVLDLLGHAVVWRQLYRSWLKETADPAWAKTFDYVRQMHDGDRYRTGTAEDVEQYRSRISLLDSFFDSFRDELGALKQWVHDQEATGRKTNDITQQLATDVAVERLSASPDPALEAFATIEGITRELKANIARLLNTIKSCEKWKHLGDAVALIERPLTGSLSPAEGKLREIAFTVRQKSTAQQVPTTEELHALAEASQEFGQSVAKVAEGVREACELLWKDAVDQTKETLKEGFQTYNRDVANGMLVGKVCVYQACVILSALSPTPAGVVTAPLAVLLALSYEGISKLVEHRIIARQSQDIDVVLDLMGKKYKGSEVNENLETTADLVDKAETAAEQGIEVLKTLQEAGKITGRAGAAVKGVGAAANAASPAIGPTLGQVGLAIDLYNADEKQLVQEVTPDRLQALRTAVSTVYQRKAEQGFQPQDVLYHGVDDDGRAQLTLMGVRGTMSPEGRFSPDSRDEAFNAALHAAKKSYPDFIRWDPPEDAVRIVEEKENGWDVTGMVYCDEPGPGWPEFADYYEVPGFLYYEGELEGFDGTDKIYPFCEIPGDKSYLDDPEDLDDNEAVVELAQLIEESADVEEWDERHPFWSYVTKEDTEMGPVISKTSGAPDLEGFSDWVNRMRTHFQKEFGSVGRDYEDSRY